MSQSNFIETIVGTVIGALVVVLLLLLGVLFYRRKTGSASGSGAVEGAGECMMSGVVPTLAAFRGCRHQ